MDTIIGGLTASAVQYSPTPAPAPGPDPASVTGAGAGVVASAVPAAAQTAVPANEANPAQSLTVNPNAKSTPSMDQVQKAVDDINTTLKANENTSAVQFAIDPSSKKIVVQMIDTQSGKVLSQYPSEEIIQMGLALGKKIGQLVNQQA